MSQILIGSRRIGRGAPCFLVAEAGINHNGDIALAHKMIDAAAAAGADAVKFQNYRTEEFISDRALTHQYVSQGKSVVESQWELFKRCELSFAAFAELKQHCDEKQLIFFSTPSSEAGLNDLLRLGVPLLKNGSDFLGHLPLIRAMARTGLPTVISTGMATAQEMCDAIAAFRQAGGRELVLLHCTSSYPTPPEDAHLRKIVTLREEFHCPVGFSDHTEGVVASLGAVALGGCMIEKHFTLAKDMPGPDHHFSADPSEFRELVQSVRTLERQLGRTELGPADSERENRELARLSCAAARELSAGHRLDVADIVFRRPGTGFSPARVQELTNRRLSRLVPSGKIFEAEDLGSEK
jgi:N-acetylneuraminate synthase/N,N'-diacetyllegionaminate synthase